MSELRIQLERAHVCRTNQRWDLYECSEWPTFKEKELVLDQLMSENGLYLKPAQKSIYRHRNLAEALFNLYCVPAKVTPQKFYAMYYRELERRFPGVKEILELYEGKLALCGGFFSDPENTEDVDLFFHNCTPEEAQSIIEEICRILPRMVEEKKEEVGSYKLEFTRNLETSNIYYRDTTRPISSYNMRKIQFIHRIYPSLAHIIGGFDVQASMIAMSGKKIVSNVMGAWCFVNRIIVVDISRCSTSFIHRLFKYRNRGYTLYFPGMDGKKKWDLIQEVKDIEENFAQKIQQLISESNFTLRRWEHDYGYGGSGQRTFEMPKLEYRNIEKVEIMHGMWLKLDYEHRGQLNSKLGNPQSHDYGANELGFVYGESQDSIDKANVLALIKGNLKNFSTAFVELKPYRPLSWSIVRDGLEINQYYEDVLSEIYEDLSFFSTSNLVSLFGGYQNIPIKYRKETLIKELNLGERDPRLAESYISQHRYHDAELKEIIESRMSRNIADFENSLKSITWMTQDPQRQWSSTIHPECLTAQEFYKGSWNGFTVFPWEMLSVFFAALRDPGSLFFAMPKDVLKMIIYWVPFVRGESLVIQPEQFLAPLFNSSVEQKTITIPTNFII